MTLVEVRNQVLTHFFTKSIFCEVDIPGIKADEEAEPFKSELVYAALADLEKLEIVRRLVPEFEDGLDAWVLIQPLNSYVQDVAVSLSTADLVGETINSFIAGNELDWTPCDKTQIIQDDMLTLVEIIHIILETQARQGGPVDERN